MTTPSSSPKHTREEVLKTLQQNADAVRAFGVRKIALFGSVARDEGGSSSDSDFLVEFEAKSFDAYMDLKSFLEALFGCSVDLVTVEAIKPRLRTAILGEAVYAAGL